MKLKIGKNIQWTKKTFTDKINRTDKPVARLTRKKREEIQVSTIKNQKKVITNNSTDVKSIRTYYEKF